MYRNEGRRESRSMQGAGKGCKARGKASDANACELPNMDLESTRLLQVLV